jgi:hypothetical protein
LPQNASLPDTPANSPSPATRSLNSRPSTPSKKQKKCQTTKATSTNYTSKESSIASTPAKLSMALSLTEDSPTAGLSQNRRKKSNYNSPPEFALEKSEAIILNVFAMADLGLSMLGVPMVATELNLQGNRLLLNLAHKILYPHRH